MSDKYEWEETEQDNKVAKGIVATVLGLLAFGASVFSGSKQTNKDVWINRDKDKLKN
ncbi:hypothetical protein KQI69_05005 [Eubacterium sp. MSJ-13]|uniref:hypothetical protein n=1 Tax=Eubacterium sp. MSJ-13 TaxID=2841513 RepID=UPI001C100273|nr:hypothetical protein [Eubacterium sp. MSJ-13]MBU5478558.1 hypothetical protein [Eubacterium sp. MSJ-13]